MARASGRQYVGRYIIVGTCVGLITPPLIKKHFMGVFVLTCFSYILSHSWISKEWHCTEKSNYCTLLIKENLCIGNYFSSL